MSLIKLQPGDIESDSPIPFPIYAADGKLLLQEGQVVATESLLGRLYDLGHRRIMDTLDANGHALTGTALAPQPSPMSIEAGPNGAAISLPDLARRVDFFHLTPAGGSGTIPVELVGVVREKAIIVKGINQDAELCLDPFNDYDAKLLAGCHLSSFQTRLTDGGVAPFGCFFLTYPENLAHSTVRRYRRVMTSVPAKVQSGDYLRAAVDVTVSNMSLVGAGLASDIDCLAVGQTARLAMNLAIGSQLRPVLVSVEVRNRRERDVGFFYGIEFVRMSEDVRHDIKDFVFERLSML
ncbi:PilZ domain-containing protein [Paraburkholderia sp. J41]|uniref:PilZ domain-containing protein n=1 Tax=Paraburkholderia sp. J41 TaxID=2805433 RepID=UPI002AC3134A|nr:PilZ domain-containing protein [Paraburkholderia sp. J41]